MPSREGEVLILLIAVPKTDNNVQGVLILLKELMNDRPKIKR